jgi:hypothetical protein
MSYGRTQPPFTTISDKIVLCHSRRLGGSVPDLVGVDLRLNSGFFD